MTIRPIQKADLPGLAELYSRTFSSMPWNEAWNQATAQERIEHFYISPGFAGFLAEDKQLLGLVLGNAEPFHTGPIFYLREMCVRQDAQRKGIGSKLLSTLENSLLQRGIASLYLMTDHHVDAIKFYSHHGFELAKESGCFMKQLNPTTPLSASKLNRCR